MTATTEQPRVLNPFIEALHAFQRVSFTYYKEVGEGTSLEREIKLDRELSRAEHEVEKALQAQIDAAVTAALANR